jgi:tetrahydromethanopterin S-methyltransferase subunit G
MMKVREFEEIHQRLVELDRQRSAIAARIDAHQRAIKRATRDLQLIIVEIEGTLVMALPELEPAKELTHVH